MAVSDNTDFRDLLAVELSKKENEPLCWLFSEPLLSGGSTYLGDLLLEGPAQVAFWNSMIDHYRSVLVEPTQAPLKAAKELSLKSKFREERDCRINDFYAEVLAVVTLSLEGYEQFRPIPSDDRFPAPDFIAAREAREVAIEVKNLREPTDRINVVAAQRWSRLRADNPQRYNFPVKLLHSHQGVLTNDAIKRLVTLLDQLPDRASDRVEEELEGGIWIGLQKGTADWIPHLQYDCGIGGQRTVMHPAKSAPLSIQSPLSFEDFDSTEEEYHQFFLKIFRVTAEATKQLFSSIVSNDSQRILAMRWESPTGMYEQQSLNEPKRLLENLFQTVGLPLQLRLMIDNDPMRIVRKNT